MNEEPQVPQQTEEPNSAPQQDNGMPMPTPPEGTPGEGEMPTPEGPTEGAPQEDDQQNQV